jgi:hypothetical protein
MPLGRRNWWDRERTVGWTKTRAANPSILYSVEFRLGLHTAIARARGISIFMVFKKYEVNVIGWHRQKYSPYHKHSAKPEIEPINRNHMSLLAYCPSYTWLNSCDLLVMVDVSACQIFLTFTTQKRFRDFRDSRFKNFPGGNVQASHHRSRSLFTALLQTILPRIGMCKRTFAQ